MNSHAPRPPNPRLNSYESPMNDGFSPSLARSSTAPSSLNYPRPPPHAVDRSHLAPEDAFFANSPPKRFSRDADLTNGSAQTSPRRPNHSATRSIRREHGRKTKRSWRKLLWVRQSFPDNYTDQATFLESLQRNPRLQPYDFWPLVADTTVIVQHVCSVIIFVVSFVCIYQERVSHVTIVSYTSVAAFLGWLLWERWVANDEDREDEINSANPTALARNGSIRRTGEREIRRRATLMKEANLAALGISTPSSTTNPSPTTDRPPSLPFTSTTGASSPYATTSANTNLNNGPDTSTPPQAPPAQPVRPGLSQRASVELIPNLPSLHVDPAERAHRRVATIKSAALISSVLLGLSPILKSLTRSTSSDSIWTMCFCLLMTNVISFDYSGGVSAKYPASLSTNAGIMASTVLASRLPSTGQVFSLTLFSIEVFGLFPVFRRYARHVSWRYHVLLTALLVFSAGGGVGILIGDDQRMSSVIWRAFIGMTVGGLIAAISMGGCSLWLIDLQKYKNEINGPWDQARPVIISRRYWND